MRILGIDPGYAIVGYGVVDRDTRGKCHVVDYGAINTPAEMPFPKRLQMISKGMKYLIENFKPDAVAIEELFFQNNTSTAIPVAEARGVIIASVIEETENLFEYTPNQIKLSVTGTGTADKHQVQQMVKMLLNMKELPKPDDAADAIACAITHCQSGRSKEQFRMK